MRSYAGVDWASEKHDVLVPMRRAWNGEEIVMSQSFSDDRSVSGVSRRRPSRVRGAVSERMRQTAGMRLANQDSNSLSFRPQWSCPPLLAAVFRIIGGEAVTLNVSAANGGTRVTVSGKVGSDAGKVANRDLWAKTLSTD